MLSTGLCMRRLGQNVEAEQFLRRAVAIRPDLIGALYQLAEISFERGAVKDAEGSARCRCRTSAAWSARCSAPC
jgi:Tfp pilus assembly protein PilF